MSGDRDVLGRFKKGHRNNESVDVKLKLMYSLEKGWKNREGYIGDIKNSHPRIYNSWRSIRHTEKGKKIGNSTEWNDFRTFYNDVVPTYKKGLVFRRLDTTKIFSKDNFMWVTSDEASMLQSNLIWLEYENRILTIKQWATELNINLDGLKYRYHNRILKKYSVKEILFGRKVKRNHNTPKDKTEVQSVREKASKMISSYKSKDIKRNLKVCDITIDWMISNIFNKECVYCGDVYRIGCDRIDNTKGHIKENVVPCCYECNVARGNNFTTKEMYILGKTIKQIKDARNK